VLQGVGNLIGSFFSCIAFAASLSRSIVGKGVGGRTQLTALVSMIIIVLTLLWVADFFEPLPRVIWFYFCKLNKLIFLEAADGKCDHLL
jgi:solute carrier family 26, other